VNRVADRKGERTADHGGNDADLDRVVDRAQRERIVEDAVKCISEYCRMSNRLAASRMNMNFRNAATINARLGRITTTSR